MLDLSTAGELPDQYELSRLAAERYAVVTAVRQQRALGRHQRHPRRAVETVRQPVAIPH